MRCKQNSQCRLEIPVSNLKITEEYFERYRIISRILDKNPNILAAVHEDIKSVLSAENRKSNRKAGFFFTSDTVLRTILCRKIENLSYRSTVIRIDDSNYLRRFVRIYEGPMIDYTTLNKLENAIKPKTWKTINLELAKWAFYQGKIEGDKVRIDTTAVENNIHYPTDAWLLWDLYRTLARLIESIRKIDKVAVGNKRLQKRLCKKIFHKISRKSAKKKTPHVLKPLYRQLIQIVEEICVWTRNVVFNLECVLEENRHDFLEQIRIEWLLGEMKRYLKISKRVIEQAKRRVIEEDKVPNNEKIFSIFEPHTELIIRGKSGKDIEFGHMVLIQQVAQKFISNYQVFEKKPVEHTLVDSMLDNHKNIFGQYPCTLAADKGFYRNMTEIDRLEKKVDTLSIAKKGRLTETQKERESERHFRLGQRFRAGVEGSISFLKRSFGLSRVMRKGWKHYVSEIGLSIFAHNLLILARE